MQREHADMSAWDERRLIGRYYGASPRPPMPHDDSWEAHTAGREQRAGLVLLLVQRPLHAARANLHGTVETKNHKPGLMIPTRTPFCSWDATQDLRGEQHGEVKRRGARSRRKRDCVAGRGRHEETLGSICGTWAIVIEPKAHRADCCIARGNARRDEQEHRERARGACTSRGSVAKCHSKPI